jgi:hypothetical protein
MKNKTKGITLGSDPELKERFVFSWVNINATDCPCALTDKKTGVTRYYGVEGDPWRLVEYVERTRDGNWRKVGKFHDNPQKILEIIFNNYQSDIEMQEP